ncbi:cell division protein FtsI (penicillin-binding protein 3) [Plantibacter flavus]|uniref:Cell division protein FtsI (Penicillin-binding protein 3) n=1 Tax=Plantibacter flavus TaxID=150123 RepID=A0A3N2BXM7_9MICO|nr:cell division protein FtsI (penicillin-binding protein 3) [Plantibacter flavus]SMG28378.1 cell division protein FtsI (penicillin-binding protein 3) [Plantibacter flavus]
MLRGRASWVLIAVWALTILLALRLIEVQIVRGPTLVADAQEKLRSGSTTFGARGSILDRSGRVLALSVPHFEVTVSPADAADFSRIVDGDEQVIELKIAAAEIGEVMQMSGQQVLAIIDGALAVDPHSNWARLSEAVSFAQFRALDALDVPWLYFAERAGRSYPLGAVAGNLVGFLGDDGTALAGVELLTDDCLRAANGFTRYERSRQGVPLPGTTQTHLAHAGGDVTLTIDADLQWFAQQALAERIEAVGGSWGAVTIVEAATGKLLTVAEYPSVDPGNVDGTPVEHRGSRAFTAPFEPGSTYKTLTMLALLEEGKATPSSRVLAPYRYLADNGADINDTAPHDDQSLTLTGVMVHSSNTGIAQLAERLTNRRRFDYFQALGQTSPTAVGFPGESGGILADVEEWDNQTVYATMFGQGLATTAVQGASLYQTVANNGVRMPLQLIEACESVDGTVLKTRQEDGERVFSERTAKDAADILETEDRASWVAGDVEVENYRVAMKTSTAQQPDGFGGYSDSYLVSMSGFFPAEAPQYVVSVNIADPVLMNTSGAASPVFRDVIMQIAKSYRVLPSEHPPTILPLEY